MKVRLIELRDMDAMLELARMQLEEGHSHRPFDEPTMRATVHSSIDSADPTIFVAEQHESVVGYLTAHIRTYGASTGIYAEHGAIFVRPDKRGTRAAALLINAFKDWAVTIGAREALMGIASDLPFERTSRLFEKFGFERVGTIHRWVL